MIGLQKSYFWPPVLTPFVHGIENILCFSSSIFRILSRGNTILRYSEKNIPDFRSWICSYIRFPTSNSVFCRFPLEILISQKISLNESCLESHFTYVYQFSTRSVNYFGISNERGFWAEIWQTPGHTQNPKFPNPSLLVLEQKLWYRWKGFWMSNSNLKKNLDFILYFSSYTKKRFFL